MDGNFIMMAIGLIAISALPFLITVLFIFYLIRSAVHHGTLSALHRYNYDKQKQKARANP